MAKNKLKHFAEMLSFPNVLQLDKRYRGKWYEAFDNTNPITLELGCGKGEYTVGLAQLFPDRNFIGVDIKGARIYTGAKRALELGLKNVFFLRTQIDHLPEYFAQDEVSEIWITFPDPYPPLSDAKRRLTSPKYIDVYRKFLSENALINLKTDDEGLFKYTLETIDNLKLKLLKKNEDVRARNDIDQILNLLTYYEKIHLSKNKSIKYIQFSLT